MEHTSRVEPPADWFISLTERKTFQTTYLTLNQLLEHSSDTSKTFINTGITLGRKSSDADYVTKEGRFDSPIISRSHAQLNITHNGHVYLTDLESMHGTSITLDAPNNYETYILAKHSPVQLLHGDNVFLGKRISSSGKDFDPVKLLIKFRYPEFGKGSTFDGRRKKIGEIKRESANGKFADKQQEHSIRRLILNLTLKQDTKAIRREEIKILEQRIEIIAEKINSKSQMKQSSSSSNNDQIQMDPEIEEEDSVEFTHEILSQDNITSKLTPIDLRSDRSSPFSVRSIDEDQENTIPTSPLITTKSNTYKAPASVLSMSEEDLPRYASDAESDEGLDDDDSMIHHHHDEDSMTDYDDEDDDQEPEVMGVHEDGSQTKLYADEDGEEVQSEDAMSYASIDEGEEDEEADEDEVNEEDDDEEEEEDDDSDQGEFDDHSDSELSVTDYQYEEDEYPQDEEDENSPLWDYAYNFPPLGKIPILQPGQITPSLSFSADAVSEVQAEAEQKEETPVQGSVEIVQSLPVVMSDEANPSSHQDGVPVGITKEAKRELIDDHAVESEISNSASAGNLEEAAEKKQEMQIRSQDVAVSMDQDKSQPAGEVESAALIPDTPKCIMDNHIAAMRAPTRPQTSFERPRTPSISDASSDGPITPESNKKRPLPDEFTIIHANDHADGSPDMVDTPTITDDAPIDRPKKRLRKIKSAIGLIALGAALGSATTVTLLLQVAPQSL